MNTHHDWVTEAIALLERTPLRDSYLISLFSNALNGAVLRRIEQDFDLARDEFNVLFTLAARGPSLASDICQLNSRPKNSISRAVGRLARRGAITRQALADDRRKELLSLTEGGIALYEQTMPIFQERQRELLAPLEYEERRMLEALLKKALTQGPDWRSYD